MMNDIKLITSVMKISIIGKIALLSFLLSFAVTTVVGCEGNVSVDDGGGENPPSPSPKPGEYTSYEDIYDEIADNGQYYLPLASRSPKMYWTIPDVAGNSDRNSVSLSSATSGLQYHLLAQSVAGLVNRALQQGRTDVGVWLDVKGAAYDKSKEQLGRSLGNVTALDLCTKTYENVDGCRVDVRSLINGYVLTDVVNNPESANVAAVASHIYNSVIVDIRDRTAFDAAGLQMRYDASRKSLSDAWTEFRDYCRKDALVVMPVQTGELREYAIANSLFVFNLNRKHGDSSQGQNTELFREVLSALDSGAPVLGWESGVGEDVFVEKVSEYGKLMIPADWSYNHTLTSVRYPDRQEQILARVVNPKEIDYSLKKKFVSFFLSDGDNYQWVMNDSFFSNYYNLSSNNTVKMSFGLCSESLCQLAPARFKYLWNYQRQSGTVMETFGGGYFYADTYASASGDRAAGLKIIARRAAEHMRQHRIKVLHLIVKDITSAAAREAYQAFVDANDSLEGIVVIAYDPYTAGKGRIQWCTNTLGYDIPVVSVKYALWQNNTDSGRGTGTPQDVAGYINASSDYPSWSAVVVHAWSDFSGARSTDAAAKCLDSCSSAVQAVNIQELIWRIRMAERPEQTLEYLETIK